MIRPSLATALAATLAAVFSFVPPALAQDDVDQRFGTVHFPISCSDTAQRRFDRGMRYQHSFWYRAAKQVFEEVLAADPQCAIAHWGIAMSLLLNPFGPPPPANLAEGQAVLEKAKAIGAKTQREK